MAQIVVQEADVFQAPPDADVPGDLAPDFLAPHGVLVEGVDVAVPASGGGGEHRLFGPEQELTGQELHRRRPDLRAVVRVEREAARHAGVAAEAVDLHPDVGDRIGDEVFHADGPVFLVRRRRRLGLDRLEGRIGESGDRRQERRVRRRRLLLRLLLAQAEDEPFGPHARRMKASAEEIEQRDRDRRLLHAEEPLDVGVAAPHREAADADHPGDPRGPLVVGQEKLLRFPVHPAAQQVRRDDQVDREGPGRGDCEHEHREKDPELAGRDRDTGAGLLRGAKERGFHRRKVMLARGTPTGKPGLSLSQAAGT